MSEQKSSGKDKVIDITAKLAEKAAKPVDLAQSGESKEVRCEGGVCHILWKPKKSA